MLFFASSRFLVPRQPLGVSLKCGSPPLSPARRPELQACTPRLPCRGEVYQVVNNGYTEAGMGRLTNIPTTDSLGGVEVLVEVRRPFEQCATLTRAS